MVLKEGKVYVPKDKELRIEIIWPYHDILVAEYGRKWKMTELVTRNYWWLEVTKDVRKYMEGCNICQRMKNRMEILAGKLKLSEVLEKLWIPNSRLYHKATISSWKGCNSSSL